MMNFEEWMKFEVKRILRLAAHLTGDDRDDFIQAQVLAALKKSFAHGRDGLGLQDEPRAITPWDYDVD